MALKKDHNSILIFFYIYRRKNRVVILSVYLQNSNLLSKKSSFKFIFWRFLWTFLLQESILAAPGNLITAVIR